MKDVALITATDGYKYVAEIDADGNTRTMAGPIGSLDIPGLYDDDGNLIASDDVLLDLPRETYGDPDEIFGSHLFVIERYL